MQLHRCLNDEIKMCNTMLVNSVYSWYIYVRFPSSTTEALGFLASSYNQCTAAAAAAQCY